MFHFEAVFLSFAEESPIGFKFIEAATGEDALRLVRENPDLVILDVNLPDMNGFEVCRRIKENPATTLIPVLHLSGVYVTGEDMVKGLKTGADGYLVRPVNEGILIATVKTLLRIQQAEKKLYQFFMSIKQEQLAKNKDRKLKTPGTGVLT